MEIPAMNTQTALGIIAEVGPSVEKWANAKHFASWLGLCPNNRISGGKRLSGKTKAGSNHLRKALGMAAEHLRSPSLLLIAAFGKRASRYGVPFFR